MSSTAQGLSPPPPRTGPENQGFGVYIHFPWCLAKCPYCDFLSLPVRTHVRPDASAEEARQALPHAEYSDAVLRELALRRQDLAHGELTSIFIGGGTPSLWHPSSLSRVVRGVLDAFSASQNSVEITAESNPSSLDAAELEGFAAAGVNRVSIGVQSLDPERLRFLGRLHSGDQARDAIVRTISSKIGRVSADMIYGVQSQSPEQAVAEISSIAALGVSHLSAYTLTIEPNTRFGELDRRGKLPLLDEALVATSYAKVSSTLEAQGFEHYEISNFAKSGERSLHNLGYWRGFDYLGLGVGAVGTISRQSDATQRLRYKNPSNVDKYIATLLRKGSTVSQLAAQDEWIDGKTAICESLMLGLRTVDGVDLELEGKRRRVDPWTRERSQQIQRHAEQGLLDVVGSRLSIPKRHWIVADRVIRDLI
jgi:putative oxygen-independent coproporphyrinogen III oxidase